MLPSYIYAEVQAKYKKNTEKKHAEKRWLHLGVTDITQMVLTGCLRLKQVLMQHKKKNQIVPFEQSYKYWLLPLNHALSCILSILMLKQKVPNFCQGMRDSSSMETKLLEAIAEAKIKPFPSHTS